MADGRVGSEPNPNRQTRATEPIHNGWNPRELEKENGDDGGSLPSKLARIMREIKKAPRIERMIRDDDLEP